MKKVIFGAQVALFTRQQLCALLLRLPLTTNWQWR